VQLRRLELVGFKTFPHRTELEFHPGITAIVGPNGTGKSNIFDGIRWALGETNARMLRGARMDDVIFAGSVGRRPHTLAQVALTLDNSSGLLPLEFAEVTVARAVTRGGDGEYAINGVDCRLRDVQMLFLGTGLGGRSYALIGQGEVDAVLRATPVERRQWLEEAAGLARHKRQRVEAERRLGHAQTHLDRLTDVLAELEVQQQGLAVQAEAATLHRTYSEELRELELALFADEARRLTIDLSEFTQLADRLVDRRQEQARSEGRDDHVGEVESKLLPGLVQEGLRSFRVVGPEVDVHESPPARVCGEEGHPIGIVVGSIDGDEGRAVEAGEEELRRLEGRGGEHVTGEPRLRRGRGGRGRQVSRRCAADRREAPLPRLRDGDGHGTILERIGRVHRVVLDPDLPEAEGLLEVATTPERREPGPEAVLCRPIENGKELAISPQIPRT